MVFQTLKWISNNEITQFQSDEYYWNSLEAWTIGKGHLKFPWRKHWGTFVTSFYIEANETEETWMDSNIQDLLIGKMRED